MRVPLALTFLLAFALAAAATAVDVGDQAPPLGTVTWVKGTPVAIGTGVTVVEMWATWCAPCRQSIPHLTELQKQHPEVTIAGVTSEDAQTVTAFVQKRGDEMAYHVGIIDDATWNTFMEGVPGPPFAYLIDAKGVVMWAGHPMALGQVLGRLKAGTFDPATAKRIAVLLKAIDAEFETMTEENHDAKMQVALAKTAEILALDPFEDKAIQIRMRIAEHLGDHALVRATFDKIPVEQMTADRANSYAWKLATAENLANRNLDLALAFANRALAVEPNNPSCHDTAARVYYDLGLIDQAIAEEQRAIALEATDADLKVTLAFYQRVKELAGKVAAAPASP